MLSYGHVHARCGQGGHQQRAAEQGLNARGDKFAQERDGVQDSQQVPVIEFKLCVMKKTFSPA